MECGDDAVLVYLTCCNDMSYDIIAKGRHRAQSKPAVVVVFSVTELSVSA